MQRNINPETDEMIDDECDDDDANNNNKNLI
jgi:hypothetical protein